MSALEKGTGFELKIAELFKQNGYHVSHNVKMKGKSGTEHQIDILAEYKAPLHISSVIIEAKSYHDNIDKDIVMKLVQIQQDLSADRAILVTTSSFTPGAISTASQYKNIELWDGEKISKHIGKMQLLDTSDIVRQEQYTTKKMIQAKISSEQINQIAQKTVNERAKGGFLGRGKIEEEILNVRKFFYPYYDVDMQARIQKIEKTGWRSKQETIQTVSSRTGIDAVTGSLIDINDDGLFYTYSYLSTLNEDEIKLLSFVAGVKEFEKQHLTAIGWSTGKIGKVVGSLCGKGVFTQTSSRPATFSRVYKYPNDPSSFQSIIEVYQAVNLDTHEKTIDAKISPASIMTAFGDYWEGCIVDSIDLIYYPYYAIVYGRKDGTKRIEIFDGMSGLRQEYLEKIISVSDIS